MPAKRKRLPLPCPKCSNGYGTIQIQAERDYDAITLRIAHYDPKLYKNPLSKQSSKIPDGENFNFNLEKENSKTRGKKWCYSLALNKHELTNFPEINHLEHKLRQSNFKGKTVSCAISDLLYEEIHEKGWDNLPKYLFGESIVFAATSFRTARQERRIFRVSVCLP